MRINKYLATCGVASRRAADQIIKEGRVKVNGKTITELGVEINIDNDTVIVDGNRLTLRKRFVYIMLNKPKGCVCTVNDEHGRKTVMEYVKLVDPKRRIFPIGRLDYDSEGLLLLTDDGNMAYKLTHPSHEISKTYIAKTETELSESALELLRNGVTIDGVKTHPAKVKLLAKEENEFRYEVVIFEGRNRQIRKMFAEVDKHVTFLKRTAIGDLKLGGLGRGQSRYLTDKEIALLNEI
ncbi:MAG: rRNA pseudouridine synthase [Christensenellaceae bacterium]|jgi:23S rRNA pseudouridine2605 synthase|nr:rRNA pseudouridine synthase [Christensenellaceae bacterium]